MLLLGITMLGVFLAGVSGVQELHFMEPHPLAGLAASAAEVDFGMLGHYGKPPADCEPDEQAFQISGVPGMVRSQRGPPPIV